ncbi:MAG: glycoside hydrolase family 3 C-terminal domain-containing protein [Roseburia sp.]|nr:glycoside hydrolase family 3 C-terminal domain-containing protein [Roseburia sp.]
MSKAKKPGKIGLILMCILLALALIVNIACFVMRGTLDMYLGSKPELSHDLAAAGEDLALRIEEEGIVLLQNKDDTLPLSKDVKQVNVFGWSSTQWINGGSGSGQCLTFTTDFLTALKDYGVSCNEDLTKMYKDFLGERPYASAGALNSRPEEFSRLYEPSVSDGNYYTQALLDGAKEFSDTAIVVLSRITGESNDAPTVQYKQTTKGGEIVEDASRTYLDLSTEEEELLAYVGANYESVIVLLNTTNAMALGPIETIPGVDAALLVGGTGDNAAKAIPEVLFGDVDPSGRVTDTYAYDFRTAASFANIGKDGTGAYTNGEGLYPYDGTTNGNLGVSGGEPYTQVSYVDYVEGIYVGYKWYETADAEGYWDGVSNDYGRGYEGVVQYPFGYGLSYTGFSWEVVSASSGALDQNGTVDVTVKVTNTGAAAGKDVVQLYYAAPYTPGGIEKSAKVLGDFAKTKLLQPGESDEVTLTLDVYDMASYDCYDANNNGFQGYELDAGDYTFYVSRNAHESVDEFTCTLSSGVKYENDPVTGAAVGNVFTGPDAVDGVSLDGSDTDANITYLTRADFKGTFPTQRTPARALTDNAKALNLFTAEMAEAWIDPNAAPITTGAKNGLSVTNSDGSISDLGLRLGADYDDPQWEALLDQMTIDEMMNLTLHGYVHTSDVPSIGKPRTLDLDGPTQVASFAAWLGAAGTGFPNPVTLAQTFNKELMHEFGLMNGAQARQLGVNGLYAPAANMHRTPFGARNYEYYSEDSYLSGVCATLTVKGELEAGTFVYVKHFICDDADAYIYRDSIYTWMTEQTLREIYLSPFRMMVQEGGCTGLMSSYNRIGAVWAGGSEALLRSVLRDEWGFKGTVLTDYADHHAFMNGDHMIRMGGDLWMDGWLSDGAYDYETSSNSFQQALRQASKHIIYMTLNAEVTRADYAAGGGESLFITQANESLNQWLTALIVFDVVVIAAEAAFFLLRAKKAKQ